MESKTHSLSWKNLADSEDRLFEISTPRCSGEEFSFEATGDDPRILFPKMDLEPVGGVFKLDITLPGEAMVQVFYQTIQCPEFSESQSVSVVCQGGRHCLEWLIDKPLNGIFRLDPGNLVGSYTIHKIEVGQKYDLKSIIPNNIIRQKLQYDQIRDLRFTGKGLKFKSVGRDPYFIFPKVDIIPRPATVRLEMTTQRETMVQFFFQTKEQREFTEELSISESRPGGRHTFVWFIDKPLAGVFRLDPGNMPWEYHVHKLELLQSVVPTKIPNELIFGHGGYSQQIDRIQIDNGDLSFQATGEDPHVFLPKVDLQSNRVRIRIEITLPEDVLVQLYYQKTNSSDFLEEDSYKVSLLAGRHSIEWVIEESLNGFFRLDPGNLPGQYVIHQIEYEELPARTWPSFSPAREGA